MSGTPRPNPFGGMHLRSQGPALTYDEAVLGRQAPRARLFDIEDIGPLAEQLIPILQRKEITRQEALDAIGPSVELERYPELVEALNEAPEEPTEKTKVGWTSHSIRSRAAEIEREEAASKERESTSEQETEEETTHLLAPLRVPSPELREQWEDDLKIGLTTPDRQRLRHHIKSTSVSQELKLEDQKRRRISQQLEEAEKQLLQELEWKRDRMQQTVASLEEEWSEAEEGLRQLAEDRGKERKEDLEKFKMLRQSIRQAAEELEGLEGRKEEIERKTAALNSMTTVRSSTSAPAPFYKHGRTASAASSSASASRLHPIPEEAESGKPSNGRRSRKKPLRAEPDRGGDQPPPPPASEGRRPRRIVEDSPDPDPVEPRHPGDDDGDRPPEDIGGGGGGDGGDGHGGGGHDSSDEESSDTDHPRPPPRGGVPPRGPRRPTAEFKLPQPEKFNGVKPRIQEWLFTM